MKNYIFKNSSILQTVGGPPTAGAGGVPIEETPTDSWAYADVEANIQNAGDGDDGWNAEDIMKVLEHLGVTDEMNRKKIAYLIIESVRGEDASNGDISIRDEHLTAALLAISEDGDLDAATLNEFASGIDDATVAGVQTDTRFAEDKWKATGDSHGMGEPATEFDSETGVAGSAGTPPASFDVITPTTETETYDNLVLDNGLVDIDATFTAKNPAEDSDGPEPGPVYVDAISMEDAVSIIEDIVAMFEIKDPLDTTKPLDAEAFVRGLTALSDEVTLSDLKFMIEALEAIGNGTGPVDISGDPDVDGVTNAPPTISDGTEIPSNLWSNWGTKITAGDDGKTVYSVTSPVSTEDQLAQQRSVNHMVIFYDWANTDDPDATATITVDNMIAIVNELIRASNINPETVDGEALVRAVAGEADINADKFNEIIFYLEAFSDTNIFVYSVGDTATGDGSAASPYNYRNTSTLSKNTDGTFNYTVTTP